MFDGRILAPRNTRFHFTGLAAVEQSIPQPGRLQDLGLPAGARVQETNTRLGRELKQRLVAVWADLEQTIVDKAIDHWRKRLRACVKAKDNTLNS